MKKAILSPLCSALIVPGLGQIINEHVKKGLFLLACVFAIFVGALIKILVILRRAMDQAVLERSTTVDELGSEDFSALWILLGIFALIWLYSVIDAYRTGRKIDNQTPGNAP